MRHRQATANSAGGAPKLSGLGARSFDNFRFGNADFRHPGIRTKILSGTYRPPAVRRVEIPKPLGGTRELGIPTVVDRQAPGVVMPRDQGTPQGGPLSPLLAKVLLDEVDQVLQQRGHRFARYADDCNVYVRSQAAGVRVLRWLRDLYAKLHLRVNEKKTAVGSVFGRTFLGYCFGRWSGDTVKIAVASKALDAFKLRIRFITRRVGGRSMGQVAEQLRAYLPGWKAYFQLAQRPQTFKALDSWLRHRLRAIQLKHGCRGKVIYGGLRRLGATHELALQSAGGGGHWWRTSRFSLNKVLTVSYFDSLGIPRLI